MAGLADTPENYQLITFNLVPEGTDPKMTLSQANLMGGVAASDVAHRANHEKKWVSVLDGLAKVSTP